jgi:Uma2 family endonuclease
MAVSIAEGSSMVTVPKRLTLEEFLELPEQEIALEFADGEVTQKVSPQGQHSVLQFGMAKIFDRFALPTKVARVFTELRITFAGVSRVPDVSVYRWDRVPLDAKGRIANEFHEPPDLVVEIVSPDQSATALVRKCLWYVAHGVKIALLVDPDDESVLLFRPNQAPLVLRDLDLITVDEVLPGFALAVAELFALLLLA